MGRRLFFLHASLSPDGWCWEQKCISLGTLSLTTLGTMFFFFSLELFLHPVLRVSSSTPIEGSPMTLICETQLSPQRPKVQLQFSFFRDSQTLGSGWSTSPELQIPAMWTEDSGFYWCETETVTHNINKRSLTSQIRVQSECPSGYSSRVRAGERKADQWQLQHP